MHWTIRRGATVGALAALLVAGSAGTRLTQPFTGSASAQSSSGNVDWSTYDGNLSNTRYSPLTQINASNLSKLGIAWTAQEGQKVAGWESTPVVINGVMYYTTNLDQVRAVNAATGKMLWQYTPKVNFYASIAGGGGGVAQNRGVTVANGVVYLLTFDARLIALQASTGEVLWQTYVAKPTAGYAESSPALYWKGMLFVGSEEGDAGQRGFEAAFSAKTGKQLWKFYTVPAPGHGWMPATGDHGGGDVWMPPAIDPSTGLLYIGTGNPSPDFVNTQRPGCDPWVDATVALNARTGKLVWAHSEVCNDVWDYDSMPSPFLMQLMIHGKQTTVVGAVNKSGFYTFMDAKTGKVLAKSPYLENYSQPHLKPDAKGVKVCPGALGGVEWGPGSFSPQTGAVYEGYVNECMTYKTLTLSEINAHRKGQVDSGGSVTPAGPVTGGLAAVDAATGKILWKDPLKKPIGGGTMTTASGLVFVGADDGHFYAVDAKTGKILWSANLGVGFGAAPVAYEVNGTEYIAIAAGGGGTTAASLANQGDTLVVFKLGGKTITKVPVAAAGTGAVPVALPVLAGYAKANQFMWVNKAQRHVVIQVIAAKTGANAGFNFDGYSNGQATFTVPLHWSVDLEFRNLGALPHSAAIAHTHTSPPTLEPFGFGVATTPNPMGGTVGPAWQLVGFVADHPGHFALVCMVPGHIQSGMWDNFVISSTATMPSITTTKGA